ncbi:IncP-type conjugative transfer protein TrbC (plasmid) [Acidisarcina polymorpha]|uniref:IncP-type conjugative transfer protein TrbC n=2 Tax=Acidisarcina polymorpha TaxID=2211140 RepID=A0A2Z5GB19_9BACT|nr:IncP-type conjugative transfer protein TrbC [Acidisarcina polymorpha]
MNRMGALLVNRRAILRTGLLMFAVAVVFSTGAFAAENGNNLPWEGPLTTLVTSLTGPVAYAISVVAIVALGATLAFRGGEMGESMAGLLKVGIAVCCVVFAAQVMASFIGQAAEIAGANPVRDLGSQMIGILRS